MRQKLKLQPRYIWFGKELAPALLAARAVGAGVVLVDRSRKATLGRVAEGLLDPRELKGLLEYATATVRRSRRDLRHPIPSSLAASAPTSQNNTYLECVGTLIV